MDGIWTPSTEVFKFLKESRIPAVTDRIEHVEKGVIAGLGWNLREGEEYAVAIVEKILRGERPATIRSTS